MDIFNIDQKILLQDSTWWVSLHVTYFSGCLLMNNCLIAFCSRLTATGDVTIVPGGI